MIRTDTKAALNTVYNDIVRRKQEGHADELKEIQYMLFEMVNEAQNAILDVESEVQVKNVPG